MLHPNEMRGEDDDDDDVLGSSLVEGVILFLIFWLVKYFFLLGEGIGVLLRCFVKITKFFL